MPNRLANETSPYLLTHAHNPVDWHPWGDEALAVAAQEDKPIFLSIGYSACHWCHVMERESFENPAIAAVLNAHFVPIKVDREERPDLDQIYMNAVQIMTGRGGWPMSVFLTPDGRPFYGGTYWPPAARHGMPGFDQVLAAVAEAWRDRRPQALEQAGDLTDHLRHVAVPPVTPGMPSERQLTGAAAALGRAFDSEHGGFGRAPKFPHPIDLELLLHVWHRTRNDELLKIVTLSLDRMAAGGMYDQLGGGFHRYSVDERWLVPHFEKMLYDNALLARTYVAASLATGRAAYAQIARETCDYVLREMTDPAGGFYSTQDADSEGEEGKFFVWTPAELAEILGDEAARTFSAVYDVTEAGNFEGASILHLAEPIETWAERLGRPASELRTELAASRQKLLSARLRRVPPARDDKVLVSWNGLMIEALATAAVALDEPRYLAAACRAADFLLTTMRQSDGRLLHSWRAGQAKLAAYLDDYAGLAAALAALYQGSFDERYIDAACDLADAMLARFRDAKDGGFFYTADDHPPLIARTHDLYDNA
ncbi:MAG TPA: thioredoxin domain-containing protein, partial [Pirellulales bacterium]|nr:thioredoxin domain-containing protein [Pirellulales bacterium]